VAVAISRREVHLGDTRPAAQRLFDQADGFEVLGPVDRRDEPHARDHVADGHVSGDLLLVLETDDLVRRLLFLLDAPRQPRQRRSLLRVALA
jgi:hypothetical protein